MNTTAGTLPDNFCCIIVPCHSCTQPRLQAQVPLDTYVTNLEDPGALLHNAVISTPLPSQSKQSNLDEGIVSDCSPIAADSDLSTTLQDSFNEDNNENEDNNNNNTNSELSPIIEDLSTNHDNVINDNNNDNTNDEENNSANNNKNEENNINNTNETMNVIDLLEEEVWEIIPDNLKKEMEAEMDA